MAGFFIAEGDLVIERALGQGLELHAILIPERRTSPLPSTVPDTANVYLASDAVLSEITGRPQLRDTLSCFVRPTPPTASTLLQQANVIAILENINNPNNLGVIIRNAAGLGIDAVFLDPRCGDPLYRRAIRSSMGQVFAIPYARLDGFPEGLETVHDHGFQTVALSPAGEIELRSLERGHKTAIVLGAEGPGLTESTLRATSTRARITMARGVDSLNVANAAAIAFHHFA